MARLIYTAGLLIAAIIHLLPVVGVLGGSRLSALYGIAADDGTIVLLMRHRAVLFGLLGAALGYAAFRPAFGLPALAAGFVSVVAFLYLAPAWTTAAPAIQRVIVADWIALAALVAAGAAWIAMKA